MGVFADPGIAITNNNWPTNGLKYFISVKVNDTIDLLAVWACRPYIEEYYAYQVNNQNYYKDNMVLIGDFNSNTIWDKKHSNRNHSIVVERLNKIGLVSAYHYRFNEKQGEEKTNTFFLYRHKDMGYHIDYAFVNEKYIKDFKILDGDEWLNYSDHKPIVLELY